MFLLTKSTLFFLDCALRSRVSKKISLGGQVKSWRAGVNAEENVLPTANDATTMTPSLPPSSMLLNSSRLSPQIYVVSTIHSAPLVPTNTPHSQTSLINPADEIFGDMVSDGAERQATVKHSIAEATRKLIAVCHS